MRSSIGLLCAALAASAAQAEMDVRLRVGGGVGQYSVDSDRFADSARTRQVAYEADYTSVLGGMTLIFDNGMYVDLSHQAASGDAKFDWSPQKPSFSRDDTTLTFGGRKGNASVYVGYKFGEANTDWPTGFQPDKLTTSGFLAGLGYAIPFKKSAITLGAGVGVLSGEYTFLDPDVLLSNAQVVDNPLQSETTIGFSLSAGYTYVFTENISVNADVRWQYYNYDFGSSYLEEQLGNVGVNLLVTF
jgi:opacity protein-like surface antigen